MTFDYTAIRSTATSILTNFGQDATVTRIGGSTFNPTTGAYSGGSTSTVSGKGVRMNYSKSEIDGEMVQRDGGTPEIDDNVLFDSENYRVMSVITISPSDTDVMYELQLRH